ISRHQRHATNERSRGEQRIHHRHCPGDTEFAPERRNFQVDAKNALGKVRLNLVDPFLETTSGGGIASRSFDRAACQFAECKHADENSSLIGSPEPGQYIGVRLGTSRFRNDVRIDEETQNSMSRPVSGERSLIMSTISSSSFGPLRM